MHRSKKTSWAFIIDYSQNQDSEYGNARLSENIVRVLLDQVVERVANVIKQGPSNCAASCWNDRLVIRLVSAHSASARKNIERLLLAIRQQPLPRVWQT